MKQIVAELYDRFGRSRRISLRTQLAVGFVAVIALTLAVGIISLLSQDRSVKAVNKLLEIDDRIAELSLQSSVSMLKARRAEKDFLLFRSEFGFVEARARYVTLMHTGVAEILQYTGEIRELTGDSDVGRQTRAIDQAAVGYEAGFLKLVELYGHLGHVDAGLAGQIRRKAREIESMVEPSRLDRLMIDLLSLRKEEKDFIARGLDKHAQAFAKGIDRFKADIALTALPAALKEKLRTSADEYLALFERYVQTLARIDAQEESYLKAAHAVEPLLEKLYVSASETAIATRDEVYASARVTTWTVIGATDTAILLALYVAWLIFQSITRSVSELRLRNRAIEASVNAVIITNYTKPDNPIEYVNPAFERITGYSETEALGRTASFLQRDERNQPGLEDIRAAVRERREGHAVLRNYRKDGSLFWNDLYIAPVRDGSGKVTHYIGIVNDITEAKLYQDQLEHQANYDTLTGLANRNLLQDRLRQAVAHAHRHSHMVAVAFLDLDHFKVINDSLGHKVGDELLEIVAQRLRSCMRETDTVARLGGDEFVLILPHQAKWDPVHGTVRRIHDSISSDPRIIEMLQRVLDTVSQPAILTDRELNITCSIGLSVYPEDGQDVETLLKNADAAMYRAKELGRNNFQFYTAEMNARIAERLSLQGRLRRALEREEFILHYQPKVHLASGRIAGMEALIRWNSREDGLVAPAKFITVLEDTGMILEVGRWVMEKALSDFERWRALGLRPPRIAVNVSQVQLTRKDFVEVVEKVLGASEHGAEALDLEITESMIMEDVEGSIQKLKAVREMGVGIAIDDFGTGYSSLSYIARLPVTALKIDRAFIISMTGNADDLAIVSTIISLAHSLKLNVIAEGVETEEQRKLLRLFRCDEMQGYLFSRPLPAEKIEEMLAGRT